MAGGGLIVSGDTIRSYLRRVNGGYDNLNSSFYEVLYKTPDSVEKERFIREWIGEFVRWKEFYNDAIDDTLPWGSNYDECEEYHRSLLEFADRFKIIFKAYPSGIPPLSEPYDLSIPSSESVAIYGVGALAVVGVLYAISRRKS